MNTRPRTGSGRSNREAFEGKVNRSQIVGPFGVGSVYELRSHLSRGSALHSVMFAGLDWWKTDDLERVLEPALQRILDVRYFLLPPREDDYGKTTGYVPSVRFPRRLVCNRCDTMGVVPHQFQDKGYGAPECRALGCGGVGFPARLIVACFGDSDDQHPGHVDDFPWAWWAHSHSSNGVCTKPQLKLETTGDSSSLSGLVVRCHAPGCDAHRSLAGVMAEDALAAWRCTGSRPWLDDHEQGCHRKVRALLRMASNVYFPVTASAISIPPASSELAQAISQRMANIIPSVGHEKNSVLIGIIRRGLPSAADYSDHDIELVLELLAGRGSATATSEPEHRSAERRALLAGRSARQDPQGQFLASQMKVNDPTLSPYFSNLVQVSRLKEVRALKGFRRVSAALSKGAVAPLSKTRLEWLPATVVWGEGVYFELNHEAVKAWEHQENVMARLQRLRDAYAKITSDERYADEAQSFGRFVLIHSLAHLIMKQFALESGYAAASMRERLYVGPTVSEPNAMGVLIYTATSGSDGTLGGLALHAEPERFGRAVSNALEEAKWCSSDPLCIESRGQGAEALNLAACHACALVPETSCEQNNLLLDRGVLIGVPDDPSVGFFEGLVLNE